MTANARHAPGQNFAISRSGQHADGPRSHRSRSPMQQGSCSAHQGHTKNFRLHDAVLFVPRRPRTQTLMGLQYIRTQDAVRDIDNAHALLCPSVISVCARGLSDSSSQARRAAQVGGSASAGALPLPATTHLFASPFSHGCALSRRTRAQGSAPQGRQIRPRGPEIKKELVGRARPSIHPVPRIRQAASIFHLPQGVFRDGQTTPPRCALLTVSSDAGHMQRSAHPGAGAGRAGRPTSPAVREGRVGTSLAENSPRGACMYRTSESAASSKPESPPPSGLRTRRFCFCAASD